MQTLWLMLDLLFARLVWTAFQATVLAAAIGLLCRWRPQLPAATRTLLWWLVGVQLLLGLLMPQPVELPVLRAPSAAAVASPRATQLLASIPSQTSLSSTSSRITSEATSQMPSVTPASYGAFWHEHWRALLALVWLAISAGLLLHLMFKWLQTRRLMRAATPLHDASLQQLYREQAQKLGLRRLPLLRQSSAIASPQVNGLLNPMVILPATQALDHHECLLAITHELVHLRRGDLWMSWIPALAQRLFFFHPLAHWAAREYALHREAACDAEVIRQHHAAHEYGRLLLRLGVAQPLHAGLGSASPTFHALRRRLVMLQQSINPAATPTRYLSALIMLALFGVLPYRLTAHENAADSSGASARELATSRPAAASTEQARDGYAWSGDGTVIIDELNADDHTLRGLQHDGQPLLLVREGSTAYALRDSAALQKAKAILAPVLQMSQQQKALADKQIALTNRQLALTNLSLAAGTATSSATDHAQRVRQQQTLSTEQQALEGQQASLSKRQAEVSAQSRHEIAVLARQAIGQGKVEVVPLPRVASWTPPLPPAPPAPPIAPPALMPPAPPLPPPPPAAPTASFTASHVHIDTHLDNGYGYALIDKDAVTVNGTERDLAAAKRLNEAQGPLWWFRKGEQAYVVRDNRFVAQARALYAALTEAQRDAGRDEGDKWKLLGPLQGLQAWQASVAEQRKALLADPSAPALKERLASLDRQQQQITTRMAALQVQLAALAPRQDAQAKRRQRVAQNTYQQSDQLIEQALQSGVAEPVSLQ